MTYDVDFISKYCCALVKTMRAHPVLVVGSWGSEYVMEVGVYDVNSMLYSNSKEF